MDDSRPYIRLEHLTYIGPSVTPSGITFNDDVTILLGGSNTGKSYTVATLNFMFGGETPDQLPEGKDYDSVLLGLSFADGTSATFRRALKGGGIEHFDGLAPDGNFVGRKGTVLSATHGKGRDGSISEFLLQKLDIGNIKIASTEAAKLDTFSMRFFMPYVLIDEDRMLNGETPTEVNRKSSSTLNKNTFRFVLTGKDDSMIARVPDKKTLDAGNSGKIELLDEMIVELDRQLGGCDVLELDEQRDQLQSRLENIGEELAQFQEQLDDHLQERREALDRQADVNAHVAQLRAMQHRFYDLKRTYETDIRRLEAIEEGGFLLQRFEDEPCPLCGALPGHQHTPHPLGDVDRQLNAARAEIAKIQHDMKELDLTLASLLAEIEGLQGRSKELGDEAEEHLKEIKRLRPAEANIRNGYKDDTARLEEAERIIAIATRRDELVTRKVAIASIKVGRQKAGGLRIGIDGPTGHRFAQVVQRVLKAWEYPDLEAVTWNESTYDIAVNGKPRARNGKGVKALLHSAFAVAVVIYCKEEKLPHPRFLVLDTPLLTYREEIDADEPLTDEERAIKATSLDVRFYEHLASISTYCQIYVVENKNPPASLRDQTIVFTRSGRRGLFPA